MKKRATNPYISPATRKLLQALNRGASLIYEERWGYWTETPGDPDTHSVPDVAIKEALHLCLIKTVPTPGQRMVYTASEEGAKVLTAPDYVPAVVRAREELKATIRSTRPETTAELHARQEAERAAKTNRRSKDTWRRSVQIIDGKRAVIAARCPHDLR